jgi:hypothetical protein
MELSITKLLKQMRRTLRKPKDVVEAPKPMPKPKKVKPVKKKREPLKAIVEGRELSLSRIAQLYNLEPHTVYARYRVGNRGKLLIRPSNRKQQEQETQQ